VKRATEVLVKAAQQAKQRDEEDEAVSVDSRKVGGIKQVRANKYSLSYIIDSKQVRAKCPMYSRQWTGQTDLYLIYSVLANQILCPKV
jgi:hypothetical protein